MKAGRSVQEQDGRAGQRGERAVSGMTTDSADSVNNRGVILHPALDTGWGESGVTDSNSAASATSGVSN